MKNTEAEKHAWERMKPGAITAQGFLGDDQRGLADIIEADAEEFRRLALEPDAVADRLEQLKAAGQQGLGEPITVENRYIITVGDARGVLPCPYGDGVFHKNSVSIQDRNSGLELSFSDLSSHLLRVHGFCQGRGSPFRLAPQDLADMLG
jgi:hypothetical protein